MIRQRLRHYPPHKGDLRVWITTNNMGNAPDTYPVKDPDHARRLIEALADSQLLDHSITDNAFGLEEWDGEEWSEWSDEEGNEISAGPAFLNSTPTTQE